MDSTPSKRSISAEEPPAGPAAAEPAARIPMWRFVALFAICVMLGFALVRAPFTRPPIMAFTEGLVTVSTALINASGGGASAQGDIMRSPITGFAVRMADGCNGIHVLIILWSAMLAFPAPLVLKLKGLFAGTLVIHGINLLRFISLFYLGQYAPNWFDFAHTYFWESMIMLDCLIIFWLWVQSVFRSARASAAGT